jgi:hypothetical protein
MICDVSAEICETCDGVYHHEEVTSTLSEQAEQAYCEGINVKFDVIEKQLSRLHLSRLG